MPNRTVLDDAVARWAKEIAHADLSFPLSKADVKDLMEQSFDHMGDVFYGGAYGWSECAAILAELARQEDGVSFNWPVARGTSGELLIV